jgi:hypothetical protein
MNSLAEILNQKADELFVDEPMVAKEEASIEINDPKSTPLMVVDSCSGGITLPTGVQTEPPTTTLELKRMIFAMKDQLDAMLRLLDGEIPFIPTKTISTTTQTAETGERILEGTFTGEKMLGDDGKEYSVPPNYASKSKIVPGDRMKLTITKSGSFIFKQIGPVDRKREIGNLVNDTANSQWAVQIGNDIYRVLTASVTFYKGKIGDEVILLLPRVGKVGWGAVDNIISK